MFYYGALQHITLLLFVFPPQRTKARCSSIKRIQGKNRKKMKLIRVTTALITCWQKLQTVFTSYK